MSYDDTWPDHSLDQRRAVIRQTIHPVTIEELKKFGEAAFPLVTDPWCEKFNDMLKSHPNSRFHRAKSMEGADIIYCKDAEKAMWFFEDAGRGFVQARGLKILSEIVSSL